MYNQQLLNETEHRATSSLISLGLRIMYVTRFQIYNVETEVFKL